MYSKIVCLNQVNRNYFCLLPLRLLLLPLNKNDFSNIVGFFVYIINTITHGCLEIWNFSSRVQFDIALNTRTKIPYLRAPMYYCLFIYLICLLLLYLSREVIEILKGVRTSNVATVHKKSTVFFSSAINKK